MSKMNVNVFPLRVDYWTCVLLLHINYYNIPWQCEGLRVLFMELVDCIFMLIVCLGRHKENAIKLH